MEYRYEARSVEAFVQQLAVQYLPAGYRYYVSGWVPEGKDVRMVDEKLLAKYGIAVSKQARARRKLRGLANLHYLRHERFFVLIATRGAHEFRIFEADSIEDTARKPIVYRNYNVGFRGGHGSVRIAHEEYARLRAYFEEVATKRSAEELAHELARVPYARYAPVRRQLLNLRAAVNALRRHRGLELVPVEALELGRRNIKVFVESAGSGCAAA